MNLQLVNDTALKVCYDSSILSVIGSSNVLAFPYDPGLDQFVFGIMEYSSSVKYDIYIYDDTNMLNNINSLFQTSYYFMTFDNKKCSTLMFSCNDETRQRIIDNGITLVISYYNSDATKNVKQTGSMSQQSEILYSTLVTKPLITKKATIKNIDKSANNLEKEDYTYYSNVIINDTKKKYGIKRCEFIYEDSQEEMAMYPEVPNIQGNVFVLTPINKQMQIYSFKNGEQYIELDKKVLNRQRLLPHYIHSYEYMIDGIIPDDPTNVDSINLAFYGADPKYSFSTMPNTFNGVNEIYSYIVDHTDTTERNDYYLNICNSYEFTAEFEEDIPVNVEQLMNVSEMQKILDGESFLETSYILVSDTNVDAVTTHVNTLDTFEQIHSYELIENPVYEEIVETIEYAQQHDLPDEQYYWMKTATGFEKILDESQIDLLNIYVLCTSYIKKKVNYVKEQNNEDLKTTTYLQKFIYEEVDNKNEENLKEFLYIENEAYRDTDPLVENYVYLPIIPRIDGSGFTKYYSYTYVLTKTFDDIGDNEDIYVKQEYREITLDEFYDYDIDELYTYEGNFPFLFKNLGSTDYISDIDINGDTLYVNANYKVIKLKSDDENDNTLSKIYYDDQNKWFEKNVIEERAKNKLGEMRANNFGIAAKVDFNGKFIKLTIPNGNPSYEDLKEANDNKPFYVKEKSYTKINRENLYDPTYNIDYYVYRIWKIGVQDVTFNTEKKIYIDVSEYGINFTDPQDTSVITIYNDAITLAEINKFGFAISQQIKYWDRKPLLENSNDLYRFPGKEYWRASNASSKINKTEILPISLLKSSEVSTQPAWLEENYFEITNKLAKYLIGLGNECYVLDDNDQYIQATIYNDLERYFCKVELLFNNLDPHNLRVNLNGFENTEISNIKYFKKNVSNYELSSEYDSMSEILSYNKKFIKTKYLYESYTVNNGIHYSKDGSYYTTISIYDGTRGTISKPIILVPNIFNITEYSYQYSETTLIDIDYGDDLSEVNENHYNEYFLTYGGNTYQLSREDKSPSYWQNIIYYDQNSAYSLQKKVIVNRTGVFNGRTTTTYNESIDDYYKEIQYFDNTTYYPNVIKKNDTLFGIVFIEPHDVDDAHRIIDPDTGLFIGPDNLNYSYEYDVVELNEYVDNNGEELNYEQIIQNHETGEYNEYGVVPFYISNEKKMEFDGTYIWENPTHSYIYSLDERGSISYSEVIKNTGYWKKNYVEKTIPLQIASYNFYLDKNEISSTSATYMYFPMSYIVSSAVLHPKISYDYIIDEQHETYIFSYIINGVMYNYNMNDVIEEKEDGTYVGKILFQQDGGRPTELLVELIKTTTIDNVSYLREIVHQEEYVSYDLFSYKDAVALTNEKIPVLYNTELVPAYTHKVQYWNESAGSYALKTVVDTQAHYVYNYKYQTVPFEVSAYIINSSNLQGSSYIDFSSTNISISDSAYEIKTSIDNVSNVISNENDIFNELSTTIDDRLNSIGQNILDSAASISEAVSRITVSSATHNETSSSNVDSNISYFINEFSDNLDSRLTLSTDDISGKLQELVNSNKKIMPETTYFLKVTYNSNNEILNAESNIREEQTLSLAEIFDKSLNIEESTITYTYNDDGTFVKTIENNMLSIAYILKHLTLNRRMPSYNEFMVDLVPKLYAKLDFDKEIVDSEVTDDNGNVISKGSRKPSPIDLAKKSIYRANILWDEMKKKGII